LSERGKKDQSATSPKKVGGSLWPDKGRGKNRRRRRRSFVILRAIKKKEKERETNGRNVLCAGL